MAAEAFPKQILAAGADVGAVPDRYLGSFDGSCKALHNYRNMRKNHVEDTLGKLLDADSLGKL